MAENAASKNKINMKTKYGAVAVLPFIVLGGAYIAFTYLNQRRKEGKGKEGKARVLKRSVSLAAVHGGKQALQRLIDYQEARADSHAWNAAISELNALFKDNALSKDRGLDIVKLQRVVGRVEMSGSEDKALQILEEQKKKVQKHEAYEIEMSIVELLIYKGEFKKADTYSCLTEHEISDARRPLFKAIIMAARDSAKDEEKVKQYWEEFNSMKEDIVDPPSLKESINECLERTGVCKTLDDFKKFVVSFKNYIKKTQGKKKS